MGVMTTAGATSGKLTYRDFLKFPDDGKRHELIDGVHYVTPSPVTPHQRTVGNLYYLIRRHLEEHGHGEIFVAPFDVVFGAFDVVEPDLLYISDARQHVLTEKHVRGAPDLVVEVLSATTRRRDEGVKLRLYDRSDVAEYWIVDPAAQSIRVYRRVDGRLAPAADVAARRGDRLESRLFPGLALPVARVFARSR